MKTWILDLLPARVSFEFQSTKSDGTKFDPTGTPTVTIYEEGGADGTYDTTQITGSPFNMAKINSKTGNYGVLVLKSRLTAGKIYRALFEATVDGVATASIKLYHVVNSASFKSDVTNLDATVSSRSTPANITNAHATTDGKVDTAITDIGTNLTAIGVIDGKVDIIDSNVDLILVDTTQLLVNTLQLLGFNQYNVDEFRTFAYDGNGRTASVTVKVADSVTPTSIWVYSYTYDGNGNVLTMKVEKQ